MLLFLLSCSRNAEAAASREEAAPLSEATDSGGQAGEPVIIGQKFIVIPPNARPGEPVTVGYSDNFVSHSGGEFHAVLLDSRLRRLTRAAFFSLQGVGVGVGEEKIKAAVLAIPSTAISGSAVIRIESADGIIRDLPFFIDSREFPSEKVYLDQQNTDLRTLPDPQKTRESQELWTILTRTGTEIYSGGLFTPPVTSTRRTSFYGNRRIYQYIDNTSDDTIHAGIDFGVPTGTEVSSCARGKVVFARSRIVTGNTVILEHLPGLYSLYYHLDSISVSSGSVIEAGSILGLSGSTGLATGPHLHWEIRVSGENTDPDIFLSRPVLDKNDILNRMRNQE